MKKQKSEADSQEEQAREKSKIGDTDKRKRTTRVAERRRSDYRNRKVD